MRAPADVRCAGRNDLDAWSPQCEPVQVGFFHSFHEGVDYVFVDHPAYHAWSGA